MLFAEPNEGLRENFFKTQLRRGIQQYNLHDDAFEVQSAEENNEAPFKFRQLTETSFSAVFGSELSKERANKRTKREGEGRSEDYQHTNRNSSYTKCKHGV